MKEHIKNTYNQLCPGCPGLALLLVLKVIIPVLFAASAIRHCRSCATSLVCGCGSRSGTLSFIPPVKVSTVHRL